MISKNLKINVNDLFNDPDESKYEELMNEISTYITEDIERRHETCLVSFMGEKLKELPLGQTLTYLIILEPFYVYSEDINVDVIPDVSNINEIEKYYDWCIDYFGIQLGNTDIGEVLVDIIDRLNQITCDMTQSFGPTFDLHTFIKIAERNKRFAEILYEPDKFVKENEGNLTAEEIVNHTHDIIDEVQECIINDPDNNFKNFITSGAGINSKQLGQVLGYIGLKPDLKEKIIPRSIDTNFCMGLRNITDYYINAVGCLKALITVKIQTKNSGYLTRKLQILLNDEYISDVDDCGTKHLLPFTVESKAHLNHINNLYYSKKSNGTKLSKINSDKNKDLIGQTIYLRTPITCACNNGICKKCYGDMYKINQNMNVGLIAALTITNMITQTNLSVKHLLQAVVLNNLHPDLLKYFNIEIDKLSIKDEYLDKISLAFNRDISCDNPNGEYEVRTITVIDGDEIIDIENQILFNINPEINELITSDVNKDLDKYVVKGKKLKDFDYIFNYSVENNSLSGPMLKLKEIIEKNEFIKSHDAFELFNKIVEILIESKSKTDYIHIGVLIKNLMKVEGNRESFTNKEFPEYTLYSVPDAIHYCSNSISKPLLFERIKDQLLLDKYGTLDKRGYSNYDVLLK
jgi:hypothetical protein